MLYLSLYNTTLRASSLHGIPTFWLCSISSPAIVFSIGRYASSHVTVTSLIPPHRVPHAFGLDTNLSDAPDMCINVFFGSSDPLDESPLSCRIWFPCVKVSKLPRLSLWTPTRWSCLKNVGSKLKNMQVVMLFFFGLGSVADRECPDQAREDTTAEAIDRHFSEYDIHCPLFSPAHFHVLDGS